MRRGGTKSPRAFTLVETLLTLAIIVMLAGSVFSFMWGLLSRRDSIVTAAADSQASSAVLERIEADLLCAVVGDSKTGAGVSGTGTRLKILSRGVGLNAAGTDGPAWDLHGSEYVFAGEGGGLQARRWAANGGPPGALEPVSERVERMEVRYHTGREWATSFDSLASGLPVAVEVSLWFGRPRSEGEAEAAGDEPPRREPDRRRVIVIADAPGAPWKESR